MWIESGRQRRERLPAMTDAIFIIRAELGAGLAQRRYEKKRIVTETTAAARTASDFAMPFCFADDGLRVAGAARQNNHAIVMRFAVRFVPE